MSASIKALLFEAIQCGWIGVIDSYLERGGDPNLCFDNRTISCGTLSITCKRGESIKLTHLAIATCCNKIDTEGESSEWQVAVSLIDSLVNAGASRDATLTFELKSNANVLVEEIPRVYLEYKPLNFARLLIQRGGINNTDTTLVSQRLDSLYAKLVPQAPSTSPATQEPIATTPVPQSVVDTYKKLLFSSDQSDVTFICQDGEEFPAHKAILAAASPYFSTAFTGPWRENSPQGIWHTSYPSPIIKAVLTFVYTGEILDSLVQQSPIQMLSIAGELGFTSLKSLAATFCIQALNVKEFKEILQLAHLHSIEELKTACYEFAKANATSVLTSENVLRLPSEDAALWNEFKAAVAPDNSN